MELTGTPTLTQGLRSHRGEVTCVDAYGAWLATGGGDRALRLWCWERGEGWREVATVAGAHRYGVTVARWSHSGVLLASGGVDGAVRVWCGRTLVVRRLLAAPGAAATRALCWTEGGRVLAGHDDGALCVWHVARGELLARLKAHEGALHAVASLARDRLSLTACTHGVLKVFDLVEVCRSGAEGETSPAPLTWIDGAHDLGALCAAATEDGLVAATGGHDARICIWHAGARGGAPAALTQSGALDGHAAAVTALSWSGRTVLASASLDRTARLWKLDAGDCLHVVHAHPRYLTCVALAPDLRYLITGSNDKSIRMWSLGAFSLDDELDPPCPALAHFALGDLEGIGPVVECDKLSSSDAVAGMETEAATVASGGATRVWRSQAHVGAINCLAAQGDLLATASSDGLVKVFRWRESEARGELLSEHDLVAHRYPALAADFGAAGAVLLTAGLDGRATLWDVRSGVQLRSLSMPGGGGGEAGGGGVRGARVSPHRPPLVLLATDDGLAPLWSLADADPQPGHVYGGHTEAVTCCAWSWDGRAAATGAASGELRLHAPPPTPATLHHCSHAHDLGVQSCDFAPRASALGLPDDTHLLATAGCDSLFKLWTVHLNEDGDVPSASVRLVRQIEAHGGAVASVRWGDGGGDGGAATLLLATAGADRWARVWRVAEAGAESAAVTLVAAVPADGAGGALTATLLAGGVLAVGALSGELSLWRLSLTNYSEEEDHAAPRFWAEAGVARWLRDYVARPPGSSMSQNEENKLLRRVTDAAVTGSRLLDDPLDDLLDDFGYGLEVIANEDDMESKTNLERAVTRDRLVEELKWLRRDTPSSGLERKAPHALLCPLSHRLVREPARAADGFTYERANILDWFLAAERHTNSEPRRIIVDASYVPTLGAVVAYRTGAVATLKTNKS